MNAIIALAGIVIKELYRRKDFYVLFILTALLTLLMGSANFFNDHKIVRYLKEICLLLIWISSLVIAITTAARQIPAERENKTIFPLLAKPVSRAQLIVGKFLGCWIASGFALAVFYLFLGVVSASREHEAPFLQYFQTFWLHWAMLGIVVALALLGSIVFAAPSSNSTICFITVFAILLFGRYLSQIAERQGSFLSSIVYTIYFLIPHLEWFDVRDFLVHKQGLVQWGACIAASVYALVYSGFFLFAMWLLFRRKPLN